MGDSNVLSLDPPLRGDGKGTYRIHIVGNSGTQTACVGGDPNSTHAMYLFKIDNVQVVARYVFQLSEVYTCPGQCNVVHARARAVRHPERAVHLA